MSEDMPPIADWYHRPFPRWFIFNAQPQQLPPALQSWLFAPHVAVYYALLYLHGKAAFCAILQLAGKNSDPNNLNMESATYRMVCAGFPLLTLGLILGSYWGQQAWAISGAGIQKNYGHWHPGFSMSVISILEASTA